MLFPIVTHVGAFALGVYGGCGFQNRHTARKQINIVSANDSTGDETSNPPPSKTFVEKGKSLVESNVNKVRDTVGEFLGDL